MCSNTISDHLFCIFLFTLVMSSIQYFRNYILVEEGNPDLLQQLLYDQAERRDIVIIARGGGNKVIRIIERKRADDLEAQLYNVQPPRKLSPEEMV
jgi:hypothetical protein